MVLKSLPRIVALAALVSVLGLSGCRHVATAVIAGTAAGQASGGAKSTDTTATPAPATTPKESAGAPAKPIVLPPTPTPSGPRPDTGFAVVDVKKAVTAENLAEAQLKDRRLAWRIEDFNGKRSFAAGDHAVIPRREWNAVGVSPSGYQTVPVLVYHNIAPEAKGKLVIAARTFEEQMRHLHAEGYRTLGMDEFVAFIRGERQIPRKSVLLTFDEGHQGFLTHALPVLQKLNFRATLFVHTDAVGTRGHLGWADLKKLVDDGFDVQSHSKTHEDLRRRPGESEAQHGQRLKAELEEPPRLFSQHLQRANSAPGVPVPRTFAYPGGEADDEVVAHLRRLAYTAAFTMERTSNPAFVSPFRIGRVPIHSDTPIFEFTAHVDVLQEEPLGSILAQTPPASVIPPPATRSGTSPALRHHERAVTLERQGDLRQALHELAVALTLDPSDAAVADGMKRLEARIESRAASLLTEGRDLLRRGFQDGATRRFLAVLALDPRNRTAFEALQRDVQYLVHTVRAGDTVDSLARLYYGGPGPADAIAETNRLSPRAELKVGRTVRLPQVADHPFMPLFPR